MPTVNCPLEGFEDVQITYPDEWLVKHRDMFFYGWSQPPEDSAPSTKETYGAIALCEKIDGLDIKNLAELPMSYIHVLNWIRDTVFVKGYLEAIEPPKNSSGR